MVTSVKKIIITLLSACFIIGSAGAVFAGPNDSLGTDALIKKAEQSGFTQASLLTPDPVLGILHDASYTFFMSDTASVQSISTQGNRYLFSETGFPKFFMENNGVGRLYYRVYSAVHGWSPWSSSGEVTSGNDDGAKVQAIQIRSKGYIYNIADVTYKVMLNDGTVLGWGKNGEIVGTMGSDKYIVALKVNISDNGKSSSGPKLMLENSQEGCYLMGEKVLYRTVSGDPYTGWGWLGNKQYYFNNSQPASGWQYVDGYKYYFNNDGTPVTDYEPLMGLTGDYQLKYNKGTRTMYVMAKDPDTGKYIIPYKTFMTTCGPDTPLGTFKTLEKYSWKFMHAADDGQPIYCQKLTRYKGSFLIHSLIYFGKSDPFCLDASTYNFIDYAQSGGCLRHRAGDANWIYSNVPAGTTLTIYENRVDKGPVEKGAVEQPIPSTQVYDPTDPEALAAIANGTAPSGVMESVAAQTTVQTETQSEEETVQTEAQASENQYVQAEAAGEVGPWFSRH